LAWLDEPQHCHCPELTNRGGNTKFNADLPSSS